MRLHLNGQDRDLPPFATVADLAVWLKLPAFGSAIELNGRVVRRVHHGETPLKEGDRLEVVKLVGGG